MIRQNDGSGTIAFAAEYRGITSGHEPSIASMAPYTYQRLRKPEGDAGEFRLVTLLHGAQSDDIRVSISTHPLPGADPEWEINSSDDISWQALSYTWGNLNEVENISVVQPDGRGGADLSVTRNLTEALRHLRYNDKDRLMWIDAICIDQADHDVALEERVWQVRSMHQIYIRADGVVIWLGPEKDDSSFALQCLQDLGLSIRVNWWTSEITTPNGVPTKPMQFWRTCDHTARERQAVTKLLERQYFDRVWVSQEFMLAQEAKSMIVVGPRSISLDNFRKAIHCMALIGFSVQSPNASHERDRLTRAVWMAQKAYSDVPNLMFRTRASGCRDDRDKVYGNLGIMSMNGQRSLVEAIDIDYSTANTVGKTYYNFFVQYQRRYNTLRLLMDSGLRQGRDIRPTWMPDWRNDAPATLDLTMETATSHLVAAECRYLDDGVLEVHGKLATRVFDIRYLDTSTSHEWKPGWCQELAVMIRANLQPDRLNERIESLSHAIGAYLNNYGVPVEVVQQSYTIYKTYLKLLYKVEMDGDPAFGRPIPLPQDIMDEEDAARFETCVRWFKITGAPFIFSADGYIGIGSPGSQVGDEVYAILGCRALILLRHSSGKGRHQVVGPCFMHGFNWGEALLGPLPEGFTVIPRFERLRRGYVPHYFNGTTSTESMWDPRISWEELRAHPPMVNFIPVTAPPGEPLRVRPDSEYLKRHDIEVQKLMLE